MKQSTIDRWVYYAVCICTLGWAYIIRLILTIGIKEGIKQAKE